MMVNESGHKNEGPGGGGEDLYFRFGGKYYKKKKKKARKKRNILGFDRKKGVFIFILFFSFCLFFFGAYVLGPGKVGM